MFFVAQGLLRRFSLFKYGIAVVLILFGAEMLVSNLLGQGLPLLVACYGVVGILVLSLMASLVPECLCGNAGRAPGPQGEDPPGGEPQGSSAARDDRLVTPPGASGGPTPE